MNGEPPMIKFGREIDPLERRFLLILDKQLKLLDQRSISGDERLTDMEGRFNKKITYLQQRIADIEDDLATMLRLPEKKGTHHE